MKVVIDISENDYWLACNHPETLIGIYAQAIKNGAPLPKEHHKSDKCKWIRYDYRTMCPENHDVDDPYWRIPENRMDALRYCPYCGKEIELEADKGEEE